MKRNKESKITKRRYVLKIFNRDPVFKNSKKDLVAECSSDDYKGIVKLDKSISHDFISELSKPKAEEKRKREGCKLQKLLQKLEGTEVSYYKIPFWLRNKNTFLKILSPIGEPLKTDLKGSEKSFCFTYRITNALWNSNQYFLEFELTEGSVELLKKNTKKKKELFWFLRKIRWINWWKKFLSNPVTLTLFGAIIGGVGNEVFDLLKSNQYDVFIHFMK